MPDATPEQTQSFNELQRVTTSPENAVRLLRELGNIDVLDLLPKVKVPTLVLHSGNDMAVPFDEGRRIAALIPGARFVPLEGRNHLLLETEPAWTKFITEVRRFLGVEQHAATPRQQALGAPLKRCPTCQRVYTDQTLKFCRVDGTRLTGESDVASGVTVRPGDDLEPTKAFYRPTSEDD